MMEVHTFHKNNFCLKQDSSTAKSQLNWKCICLKFLAYCLPLNHCVFGYTRATIVLRKIRYDLRLQQYKMIQKESIFAFKHSSYYTISLFLHQRIRSPSLYHTGIHRFSPFSNIWRILLHMYCVIHPSQFDTLHSILKHVLNHWLPIKEDNKGDNKT